MKKIVTTLAVAAMLATAAVATSGTAEARWGGGWHGGGWWGPGVGFAAGALVGSAIASSYYYPCLLYTSGCLARSRCRQDSCKKPKRRN